MSQQFHAILRKTLIWGGVLFLLAMLQTGLCARVAAAFPYGATPDLLLAAVVAIAIFDGERTGAVAGIAAGFLAGALGGTGFNLLPLCYMLCAYVCGAWSTMSLSANFASWCVYMPTSAAARALVSLVTVALTYGDYTLTAVANRVLFPEFAATLLVSPVIYFVMRRVATLFNRRLRMME